MNGGDNSDHPLKPRRPKSREISSRFLSPAGTPLHDSAVSIPSPTQAPSTDSGGLWPPSTTTSPEVDTLANHFQKERLKDLADRRKDKENHRPSFDKFRFPGKTSLNSSPGVVPARHSVDENVLYKKATSRRYSDVFRDNIDPESDNGSPKNHSFSSYSASTASSRKSGKDVSSKYLTDLQTRPRKGSSSDSCPKARKFSIKRGNSISGSSQWALSPGRSGSPPVSGEQKGKLMGFSNLKPPSSPSRAKGVEKLWHIGVSLFKGNKFSSSSAPPLTYSGPRSMNVEAMHQLRVFLGREKQWRFANARADAVNERIVKKTEKNLVYGWDGIRKLQKSVLEKRIKLEKEKLRMKLNFILHSQMNLLETWGDMEIEHLSTLFKTRECLHSAVYKVPLIEGANMNPQSTRNVLRHASDLMTSIQSTLTSFSPTVEETVVSLAELAEVVAREKLVLEECFELFKTISILEIEERSLRCSVVQLKSLQQSDDICL